MKKSLLILAVLCLLLTNVALPQGWVAQTSGVGTVNLTSVNFITTTMGLASGSNGTIIKTTNGGTNWSTRSTLTANALNSVFWASGTNAIAVGQFGIILRSTNSGDNWSIQTTGTDLNSVIFPSASIGYAVGASGTILKTTNGGVNWTAQTSGITTSLSSVYFISVTEGYASGATGRILKTTNGGTNWTSLTSGLTVTLNSVFFISSTIGWSCGATGNMTKTINSGINWTGQAVGGTNNMTCVQFKDPNSGWATGSAGRISFTTNGGTNWATQTSPAFGNLNSVYMVNSTTGWIVGANGAVLKTTTGGLTLPTAPVLTTPTNGSSNISVTPTLNWNSVAGATSYKVQISTISNFGVITDSSTVLTNSYPVPPGRLQNATSYFWRVCASNTVGTGPFSTVFNFSTVVLPPPVPVLLDPANGAEGLSVTPTLSWQAIAGAISYHVQVSPLASFSTISDSASTSGTQRTVAPGSLGNGITYFWRVRATNSSGTGSFSSAWTFSTLVTGINLINSEIPKEFKLFANYPNPFNPTTKIRFAIPKSEFASIKIYDNTGKMVSELLSKEFAAGTYEVDWNASYFSSGVYFYKIESVSFSDTKRMLLVK